MPRFRSAKISLMDGEEQFLVEARPQGARGKRWRSWIPYRTGDDFVALVTVSTIAVSGNRIVWVRCHLEEPGIPEATVIPWTPISLPYEAPTLPRMLAKTGEYVLGVDLTCTEPIEGQQTPFFNRRLMSFKSISQDDAVATNLVALLMSIAVFVVGTLVT